ncbi:glycosyltransferase family 2 protein [uncultured Formosa sp.]|uniref:glycosyltransferase family 2 protein n=1 Tax=uncultured Formosa sp. TaxID=255435 RepID=UPI00262C3060|nr:glycosyltransferase family 2 protein [uncultured Formosa sp.]
MKLSIITINYNDINGLESTFKSVFNQTYQEFEYIVVDGGSTDGGKALIEEHSDKINYWICEPDNGVYDAMNKGINEATGEYLYFLNSGDTFYNKDVLSNISKLITKNAPDIVYGDVNDVDEKTGDSKIRPKKHLDKIALFNKMVCHQALFCKKTLFVNNLFNTDYKIKGDYNFLLKAFTLYQPMVLQIDLIIANYLMGGLSDVQYNTYSVKEIPQIRNAHFSQKEQQLLRRYIFNPKIESLPLGHIIKNTLKYILQIKHPNLS